MDGCNPHPILLCIPFVSSLAQVGDGQTVRLSLLSFGGRRSSDGDDAIMESPAKTCYEVGAVQVSDARCSRHRFRFSGPV